MRVPTMKARLAGVEFGAELGLKCLLGESFRSFG
jgi:hypothetical protein